MLGLMVKCIFNLLRNSPTVTKVAAPFYTLTMKYEGSSFSPSSPLLVVLFPLLRDSGFLAPSQRMGGAGAQRCEVKGSDHWGGDHTARWRPRDAGRAQREQRGEKAGRRKWGPRWEPQALSLCGPGSRKAWIVRLGSSLYSREEGRPLPGNRHDSDARQHRGRFQKPGPPESQFQFQGTKRPSSPVPPPPGWATTTEWVSERSSILFSPGSAGLAANEDKIQGRKFPSRGQQVGDPPGPTALSKSPCSVGVWLHCNYNPSGLTQNHWAGEKREPG